MGKRIQTSTVICLQAASNLAKHYGIEMAGYLTFLALLSLFPYLVLMVWATGLLGQGETGRHFIELLLEHLPRDAVAALRPRIVEITSGPPHGVLTFSILSAIWTASSAVEAVRGMLNRAYQVRPSRPYFSRRITSIAQIIMLSLLILLVMLVFVFAPMVLKGFTHYTGLAIPLRLDHFMRVYFIYMGAFVMFTSVALFYYVLPNIRQKWRDMMPGALLVVALWIGSASLVSFYLHRVSEVTLVYGSLSGFIATLIFLYVMNLIFIYGAEFNYALLVTRDKTIIEREAPAGVTVH